MHTGAVKNKCAMCILKYILCFQEDSTLKYRSRLVFCLIITRPVTRNYKLKFIEKGIHLNLNTSDSSRSWFILNSVKKLAKKM